MKKDHHIPGLPKTPQPEGLAELAGSLQHPAIVRTGVTTTGSGRWAVLVVVKKNTTLPLHAIEQICTGYPVIYQEDSGRMPVARPAYPQKGE